MYLCPLSFYITIRGYVLSSWPLYSNVIRFHNVVVFKVTVYLHILWYIFNPACFLRVVFYPSYALPNIVCLADFNSTHLYRVQTSYLLLYTLGLYLYCPRPSSLDRLSPLPHYIGPPHLLYV